MKKYILKIVIFMLLIIFLFSGVSFGEDYSWMDMYKDYGSISGSDAQAIIMRLNTIEDIDSLTSEQKETCKHLIELVEGCSEIDSNEKSSITEVKEKLTGKTTSTTEKKEDTTEEKKDTTDSTDNSNTDTSGGSSYWGPKNQQSFLDQWSGATLNQGDPETIINKFVNAPDDAIAALTPAQVNQIIGIIGQINNTKGTSARPSSADIDRLLGFADRLKSEFPDSASSINSQITKLEEMKGVSQNEEHNEEVINDPNSGAVDPDDLEINDDDNSGPSTGTLGSSNASANHKMDDIIGDAEGFLNKGTATIPIDGDNLKKGSSTLYNILLSVGIFLAVAIGMYLGAKFMVSTAEDKAKVKEALIPYIAGCIVIFTAFAVWRIAILLLGGIA